MGGPRGSRGGHRGALVVAFLQRNEDGPPGAGPAEEPTARSPQTSAPPASPTARTPAPAFRFQPLWPFADAEDAAEWQRRYRAEGHQPWHLDAGDTALAFTRGFLGYDNIDLITSSMVTGDEAWIGVGYDAEEGGPSTAAVLHLARLGAGEDAPWEVVG